MGGKVVFEGKTKSGIKYLLRYPKSDDLEQLLEYINNLSSEQTFIRFQGEQLTVSEEKENLDRWLEGVEKHTIVQLLMFADVKLIGISGVFLKSKVESHVGDFGISIAKEFRSQGLGKILMEKVLEEAEKNLPNLKLITLTCFAKNTSALHLYKEVGFIEFGKLPEGLLRKGEFTDQICMYKKIR